MAMNNSDLAKAYVDFCLGALLAKPSGKASNFRFERHALYSYNTQIVQFYPVERVFLLSSEKYSSTTAKQLSYLFHWLRFAGAKSHYVRYITRPDHPANINHYRDRAKGDLLSALRARVHTHDGAYLYWIKEAVRFAKTFNLPIDLETFSPTALIEDEKLLAKYVARRISGEYQPMQAYV